MPRTDTDAGTYRVAVIGAGPRGTSVVHRLGVHARRYRGAAAIEVHVIEPLEPGAGAVWRTDQPRQLLMNSTVSGGSFFDPVLHPGIPALASWFADRFDPDTSGCPGFAPRAEVGRYLTEAFRAALDRDGPAQVIVHRTPAVRLRDLGPPGGPQLLDLAGRSPLVVDAVVLAQGHPPVGPSAAETRWAERALRDDWLYVGARPADRVPLDALEPGRPTALRGMGLTATDLVALLTEGRGGRFVPDGPERLRYLPSGAEPAIHLGSRGGLPLRAKPGADAPAVTIGPADFLTADRLARLPGRALDFAADIWPLVQADVRAAYFREIRRQGGWAPSVPFADLLAALDPVTGGVSGAARIARHAVRDGRLRQPDRWWARHLRPPGPSAAGVLDVIEEDLRQPLLPDHAGRLAARSAFIRSVGVVGALDLTGRLSERSVARDLYGWFEPLSSALTSGPPRGRLQQWAALARAGVVTFLGGAMTVRSGRSAAWVGGSATVRPIRVDSVVEARLPAGELQRTTDPLLRDLLDTGQAREVVLGRHGATPLHTGGLAVDGEHRVVDGRGRPHPTRWAIGPAVRVDRTAGRRCPESLLDPAVLDDRIADRALRDLDRPGSDVFATATAAVGHHE